jgi:hypothetical protein
VEVSSLSILGINLFGGTWGSGLWRLPMSEVMVENRKNSLPDRSFFKLSHPSRSNPNAIIRFSLSCAELVTAIIYDLSGHKIANLVNKKLGPGSYSLTWDTRKIAAGCYAVVMQAGNNTCVKNIPVFR